MARPTVLPTKCSAANLGGFIAWFLQRRGLPNNCGFRASARRVAFHPGFPTEGGTPDSRGVRGWPPDGITDGGVERPFKAVFDLRAMERCRDNALA